MFVLAISAVTVDAVLEPSDDLAMGMFKISAATTWQYWAMQQDGYGSVHLPNLLMN